MSATGTRAIVTIPPDMPAIEREAWLSFCAEHGLVHTAGLMGDNLFHTGRVRAMFGATQGGISRRVPKNLDWPELAASAREIAFSTVEGDDSVRQVADLALSAVAAFRGRLDLSPEVAVHVATR